MKSLTNIILVLLMFAATITTRAQSGTTGDLLWSFAGGTLTISGEGTMPNYNSANMPWYSLRTDITDVVIEDGVTGIGNYAFYGHSVLTSAVIPASVISFGTYVFQGCSALQDAYLQWNDLSSVTVSSNVFQGLTLSGITLHVPTGVSDKYRQHAFWYQFNIPAEPSELPCPAPSYQGTVGSLLWALCDGTLTVSGAVIPDYTTASRPPWYEHRGSITKY